MKPQGHKKKTFKRRRPTLQSKSSISSGLFLFIRGPVLIFCFSGAAPPSETREKKKKTRRSLKINKKNPDQLFLVSLMEKRKKFLNSKFQTIGFLFWNLFFVCPSFFHRSCLAKRIARKTFFGKIN